MNRERQKLITEIIDFHSSPEEFPRGHEQVDVTGVLEYIDKCEERARQDERRRLREKLLSQEVTEAAGYRLSRGSLFPDQYRTDNDYRRKTDDLSAGVVQAALTAAGLTEDER